MAWKHVTIALTRATVSGLITVIGVAAVVGMSAGVNAQTVEDESINYESTDLPDIADEAEIYNDTEGSITEEAHEATPDYSTDYYSTDYSDEEAIEDVSEAAIDSDETGIENEYGPEY